jgi:hypothetical protein
MHHGVTVKPDFTAAVLNGTPLTGRMIGGLPQQIEKGEIVRIMGADARFLGLAGTQENVSAGGCADSDRVIFKAIRILSSEKK